MTVPANGAAPLKINKKPLWGYKKVTPAEADKAPHCFITSQSAICFPGSFAQSFPTSSNESFA